MRTPLAQPTGRDPGGQGVPVEAHDEHALFAAFAAGDRAAGERLVEATYGQIYGALFRMTGGNADLAADLTQDTYRKAWESIGGFAGRSRFSTWLYRIAYTTFLNHVRRPLRLVPLDEPIEAVVADPAPREDELLAAAEERRRLRAAVLELDDDLRFAVAAHYWAEVPVKEIARHEGLTPVGIRKRLGRALRALDAALEEHVS